MTGSESVRARLETLPRKIRIPLQTLLDAGQLSEEILATVLDAADLAGDSAPLLGFAIGYLYMTSCGVPLQDTIQMAKAQGRRVNLRWSTKRWQTEHSRLSRAAALHQLAAANVRYDLSSFRRHLPAQFTGYLIPNSRRLAMEGFRQRHCVASYHDLIARGAFAIAVVFLDHQRWTVQIAQTADPQSPLRIAAIHTREDATPSPAQRASIEAILGIEMERAPDSMGEKRHCYLENLRRILPVLRELHVSSVLVSFEGSGDEGSISGVCFEPELAHEPSVEVESLRMLHDTDTGRWIRHYPLELRPLTEAIEVLTQDYLEEAGVNWYDGDGGFGELTIEVDQGTVQLEINTRYIQGSLEFSRELDILTGESL